LKNFRLFFVFFFFSLLGFSQISKIHYIPPLTANDRQQGGGGSIPFGQYLYLSTPSTQPVSGTITILSTNTQIAFSTLSSTPLRNDNPITYEIVPQTATSPAAAMNNRLFVDSDDTANSTGIQVLKAGLLVEADCPIYVSVRYYAGAQSGAFTTKGVAAMGTEFRTGMMTNGSQSVENANQNGSNSQNLNFFSVMATENNTIVEIELPNAASILLGGITNSYTYSGGSKIQKTLQQHESIILAQDFRNSQNNGSDRFGLIGALIKSVDVLGNKDSSKPVVVNTGSASGTFAAASGGHDHGVDQIVGINRVGHEYIFVRGDGEDGSNYELENPLVVAAQDGTEIYIGSDTSPTTTLNAGESLLISSSLYSKQSPGGTMYVKTQNQDFKLFAYQGVGGNGVSTANQGMFFVPPLNEDAQDDVDNIADIEDVGGESFSGGISVVSKVSATVTVSDATGNITLPSPEAIDGKPDYHAYNIINLQGEVKVVSDEDLYVNYYGFSGDAAIGGFYSGFTIPPNPVIAPTLASLGYCIIEDDAGNFISSNIELDIQNSDLFDGWVWEIYDGSTSSWIDAPNTASGPATQSPYIPEVDGTYRLKGIINCLAFDTYSGEINVSICPEDFDEDGIIDNLDLDFDNDGILNSVESLGNLTLDLSTISAPVFRDASGNTITINSSTDVKIDPTSLTSSSVTGSAGGTINMSLEASTIGSVSFEIKTTAENLNYRFTGESETKTAGDYFTIEVLDSKKNITLLDPNDELIIDINANIDSWEEGITQYTSNEIRFRYKNDTANPTYEFLAYDVDGIKITSYSNKTTTQSDFRGKIEIVDYGVNSDKNSTTNPDNLYDYNDDDSDGDDCFDLTEAGFNYAGFVGDPDNDGMLGTSPITTSSGDIDTRGRVISHNAAGGYSIDPNKNSAGEYYFQIPGDQIQFQKQPTSPQSACSGTVISFDATIVPQSAPVSYQWQLSQDSGTTWIDVIDGSTTLGATFSGATTYELTLTDIVKSEMDGLYRILVFDDQYLCGSPSNEITFTATPLPADPISKNAVQTFCFTDSPTVGDLEAKSNPNNYDLLIYDDYDISDSSVGTLLNNTDPLVDGQFYYLQFYDPASGCYSNGRATTSVRLSDPDITASLPETCPAEDVDLTVNNVPQTALDFELANPTLNLIGDYTYTDPATGISRTSYYFVDPNQQTFTDTETLLPTYGIGASLYVINSLAEHDAVWNLIVANSLDGTPFWLGLKQNPSSIVGKTCDNDNDGDPDDFCQGWQWLDGRPLDLSWNLWDNGRTIITPSGPITTIEPNDYDVNWVNPSTGLKGRADQDNTDDGSENYGHFNLGGSGKLLNDYPATNQSRPLYEFSGTTTVEWFEEDPLNPGTFVNVAGSPTTTTITVNPTQTTTYKVIVRTDGVACETTFTHTVNPPPVPVSIPDFELFDNDDDGDANNGILTDLDFIALNIDDAILANETDPTNFDVTFYEDNTDAQSGDITKAITFPYTNPDKPDYTTADDKLKNHWTLNETEIFVRVENKTTGCVDATTSFKLVVIPIPVTYTAEDIVLCDDTTSGTDDDTISIFDLTLRNNDLRSGNITTDPKNYDNQSPTDFQITYYTSLSGAQNKTATAAITNPVNYQSDPSLYLAGTTTQEIFYNIEKVSGSYPGGNKYGKAFDITINPLPVIKNALWKVEQCDNPDFNLTKEEENLIVGDPVDFTFEYYDNTGTLIPDPTNYTSPITGGSNIETIDVTIYTKPSVGVPCFRTAEIELTVGISQIPANFVKLETYLGESDPDLQGQSQDGFETFNKSIFTDIENALKIAQPSFLDPGTEFVFYPSEDDAAYQTDKEIDKTTDFTTYLNDGFSFNATLNRWEQEIWVYVKNTSLTLIQTSCVGLDHVATLYIEKRAIAYDVDIQEKCDEKPPFGYTATFDPEIAVNQLLTDPITGIEQDRTLYDFEYTYVDNTGATVSSATIPNPFETSDQIVTLRLTNINGNATPKPYSEGTFEYKIYQTPLAYSIDKILCDDIDTGSDTDGESIFLMDNIKTLLLTDVTGTIPAQDFNDFEFTFEYNSAPWTFANTFQAKDGDQIIATITNPLFPTCNVTKTIDFVVNPLPEFTVDDDAIVCLNLPPIRIGVESASDVYTYTWEHTNLNGTTSAFAPNDPTSANNDHILIGEGGTYHVTATTTDGTNCSRTLSIEVEESEIATVTLDDITVEDLTSDNNNTITIDTSNLGLGDYEFAIDDPFGPYQNDPFFEQVRPGIHTIYIRDKNDCGIAEIEVSVIGYKKFFTPNGDGIHDTWRILGIREDFQPNSRVYIFDRYGKLIKELDPITEGWDGTYLGRPMPQTDYWFRVFLEDGREFKGHFSLVRGRNGGSN